MDPSLHTLIEQAEFKESFRGYDRAQVDDTLEDLSSRAAELERDRAEAVKRLEDAETRIRAEAEAEIEARVKAKVGAGGTPPVRNEEQDAEEVRLTLVMAQRTADAAVAEARVKAAELLDAARTEALRTTADARSEATREREEGRKRLASEVKELEGVRTVLHGDISAMELHVKAQREQLLAGVDRLRQVLNDPAALRTAPSPTPTPVVIPEPPVEEKPGSGGSKPVAGDTTSGVKAAAAADGARAPGASAPTAAQKQSPTAPAKVTPAAGGGGGAGANANSTPDATAPKAPQAVAGPASSDAADEEDAFLSELRKAMNDDDPLGPGARRAAGASQPRASESDKDKSRFGRRR